MSRKTTRVLIVDDHAIVREGYRALLAKHEGITVVGEACDAASAYHCYKDKGAGARSGKIALEARRRGHIKRTHRWTYLLLRRSDAQCLGEQCEPVALLLHAGAELGRPEDRHDLTG